MDRADVENPKAFRLLIGALELSRRKDLGQVEEGTRDRGHWDSVDPGLIRWVEGAALVDRDAGASTGAPWGRDVDRVPLSGAKAVKRRGVAMAQNSPWPERKYRSSPPGAWCQRPDRVDAPVDGPQAPVGRAQLHGGPAHPCHAQLASGDDAVLATREGGDGPISTRHR
jgi:hypothetical protein